jgi:membrane protease YdiL (CAAX protease family)
MENPEQNSEKRKGSLSGLNPLISPGLAAVIGLIGVFILYQVGGSVLTLIIFGFDLKSANIQALRLMTMAGQILLILLPALILTKYVYEDVTTALRFRLPRTRDILIFIAGLFILVPLFQSFLYLQNYALEQLAMNSAFVSHIKELLDQLDKLVESAYGDLLSAGNIFEGILVVAVIAVTPALCEEILFRGFIQTSFELTTKPLTAGFLTALFFGLYHFNPYGLIPLVVLGMYLSYSVYITDSIFVAMALHFINNFVSVILFFIFGNEDIIETNISDKENIGSHFTEFILLATLFIIFITFIHKYYKKSKEAENDLPQM